MALRRLLQHDPSAGPAGGEQALPMDGRRMQHLASAVATLPRGRKQVRAGRGAEPPWPAVPRLRDGPSGPLSAVWAAGRVTAGCP